MRAVIVILSIMSGCLPSLADMVEVSVEIAEINNTRAKEMGISWPDEITAGEISFLQKDRLPAYLPGGPSGVPSIITSGDWSRYTALSATLKMLSEKGVAKILSKPKLATRSGTSAKFLVGGEMPVVAAGIGGGSIEWKEFGINLEIKPVIVGNRQIDTSVLAVISRLDWLNKIGNYPAIASRSARSQVLLNTGDTFTIAGLGETKRVKQTRGVPLLMDIPLLGVLFSRTTWIDVENTVVIFVTPKIAE